MKKSTIYLLVAASAVALGVAPGLMKEREARAKRAVRLRDEAAIYGLNHTWEDLLHSEKRDPQAEVAACKNALVNFRADLRGGAGQEAACSAMHRCSGEIRAHLNFTGSTALATFAMELHLMAKEWADNGGFPRSQLTSYNDQATGFLASLKAS